MVFRDGRDGGTVISCEGWLLPRDLNYQHQTNFGLPVALRGPRPASTRRELETKLGQASKRGRHELYRSTKVTAPAAGWDAAHGNDELALGVQRRLLPGPTPEGEQVGEGVSIPVRTADGREGTCQKGSHAHGSRMPVAAPVSLSAEPEVTSSGEWTGDVQRAARSSLEAGGLNSVSIRLLLRTILLTKLVQAVIVLALNSQHRINLGMICVEAVMDCRWQELVLSVDILRGLRVGQLRGRPVI